MGDTPWYPQIQWETTANLEEDERPNRVLSIATKLPPARIDTTEPDPTLGELPAECQIQADVLRTTEMELHEHDKVWSERPASGSKQRRTPLSTKEAHEE